MATDIVHVRFQGSWEALYVNGKLAKENHDITVGEVLKYVDGEQIGEARSEWNPVNLEHDFGASAPDDYDELPDPK